MKKTVLFYYPSNTRSIAFETIIFSLQRENIEFSLLTTSKRGSFHETLERYGVATYTSNINKKNSLIYYIRQIIFLVKFTRNKNFDYIFSHLQHTNFICVIAQFFVSAKCIVVRHHFKFNKGFPKIPLVVNKKEAYFDKVINFLSKTIIVPSSGVYNGMKNYEKVNMRKVKIIPYMYNFSNYSNPNIENCKIIRKNYSSHLLVIMVSRLVPFKRHDLIFPLIKKLSIEGLNIKMIVLDSGSEEDKLKSYIKKNNLEDTIFMLGYKEDLVDYMNASDILILPSLTEASNSVTKEMGLLEKAVAVCKNVGDFNDYIQNEKNGFLMDTEEPEIDAERILRKAYYDKKMLDRLGKELKKEVINRFENNPKTLQKYKNLFN
tara:strand:+ start:2546 stop:3673 length:1128 start_codon:yes stop_codon:yes gene_type:complete